MDSKKDVSWRRRIGDIEPVLSIGQRFTDFIVICWPYITSAFIAGGGMGWLAYVTEWTRNLGPVMIGGVALVFAILAWVGVSKGQALRAHRRKIDLETEAIRDWNLRVDGINPLEKDFRKVRIRVVDLFLPFDPIIEKVRFTDCQLIGPANILFRKSTLDTISFVGCDVIVARPDARITNVFCFEDVHLHQCEIFRCSIIVSPEMLKDMPFMQNFVITYGGGKNMDDQVEDAKGSMK